MKEAPLYSDALQLARWVGDSVPTDLPAGRRTHRASLDLLEHITLALQGFDQRAEIDEADRALARLRALLRLCRELGLVSDGGLLHVATIADGMGRQIGGWLRKHAQGRS